MYEVSDKEVIAFVAETKAVFQRIYRVHHSPPTQQTRLRLCWRVYSLATIASLITELAVLVKSATQLQRGHATSDVPATDSVMELNSLGHSTVNFSSSSNATTTPTDAAMAYTHSFYAYCALCVLHVLALMAYRYECVQKKRQRLFAGVAISLLFQFPLMTAEVSMLRAVPDIVWTTQYWDVALHVCFLVNFTAAATFDFYFVICAYLRFTTSYGRIRGVVLRFLFAPVALVISSCAVYAPLLWILTGWKDLIILDVPRIGGVEEALREPVTSEPTRKEPIMGFLLTFLLDVAAVGQCAIFIMAPILLACGVVLYNCWCADAEEHGHRSRRKVDTAKISLGG